MYICWIAGLAQIFATGIYNWEEFGMLLFRPATNTYVHWRDASMEDHEWQICLWTNVQVYALTHDITSQDETGHVTSTSFINACAIHLGQVGCSYMIHLKHKIMICRLHGRPVLSLTPTEMLCWLFTNVYNQVSTFFFFSINMHNHSVSFNSVIIIWHLYQILKAVQVKAWLPADIMHVKKRCYVTLVWWLFLRRICDLPHLACPSDSPSCTAMK